MYIYLRSAVWYEGKPNITITMIEKARRRSLLKEGLRRKLHSFIASLLDDLFPQIPPPIYFARTFTYLFIWQLFITIKLISS